MNTGIDIKEVTRIALEAGELIMAVYSRDFGVAEKADRSPLTEADEASHAHIRRALESITPSVPLLSEEGAQTTYNERKSWDLFWMVDPLDGTKEFIKKNGDFTVNIALIQKTVPVLGVVYAPAKDLLYFGTREDGSYKTENSVTKKLNPKPFPQNGDGLVVAVSSSHPSKELETYLQKLDIKSRISIGSALKLCYVAEGKADIYPRLGPTMEWDTAAAHAILNGVGKKVLRYEEDLELEYNKSDLLNPWFIAK